MFGRHPAPPPVERRPAPEPVPPDELVALERTHTFNRARRTKREADEALQRAERTAASLVHDAQALSEVANAAYRDARLALRRVSDS